MMALRRSARHAHVAGTVPTDRHAGGPGVGCELPGDGNQVDREAFVDQKTSRHRDGVEAAARPLNRLVIASRLPAREFHISNPGLRAGVSTWFQTHLC